MYGVCEKEYFTSWELFVIIHIAFAKMQGKKVEDMSKLIIYWLLEDCKRYGTFPYCRTGQMGFIAVQILKSLTTCGILTESDYELCMNEVNTVSSGMNTDFRNLSKVHF